jgi:hypothetical protein
MQRCRRSIQHSSNIPFDWPDDIDYNNGIGDLSPAPVPDWLFSIDRITKSDIRAAREETCGLFAVLCNEFIAGS